MLRTLGDQLLPSRLLAVVLALKSVHKSTHLLNVAAAAKGSVWQHCPSSLVLSLCFTCCTLSFLTRTSPAQQQRSQAPNLARHGSCEAQGMQFVTGEFCVSLTDILVSCYALTALSPNNITRRHVRLHMTPSCRTTPNIFTTPRWHDCCCTILPGVLLPVSCEDQAMQYVACFVSVSATSRLASYYALTASSPNHIP